MLHNFKPFSKRCFIISGNVINVYLRPTCPALEFGAVCSAFNIGFHFFSLAVLYHDPHEIHCIRVILFIRFKNRVAKRLSVEFAIFTCKRFVARAIVDVKYIFHCSKPSFVLICIHRIHQNAAFVY